MSVLYLNHSTLRIILNIGKKTIFVTVYSAANQIIADGKL